MNLPYIPDADRRALMADRHRASRPLVDLVARERLDLAVRPATEQTRVVAPWPWTGPLRAIQSLASALRPRPATPAGPMTRECA